MSLIEYYANAQGCKRLPDPKRPLPEISPMNEYFWCGGKYGQLHILRCSDCEWFIHPYAARCTACGSANLSPEPVSGKGRVAGFTINYQPWIQGVEVPYVIALIELAEQPNVRLMTNLPECAPEEVAVGMEVEVYFEQQDDIFVPLFRPAGRP